MRGLARFQSPTPTGSRSRDLAGSLSGDLAGYLAVGRSVLRTQARTGWGKFREQGLSRPVYGALAALCALLAVLLAVHDYPYDFGRVWPFGLFALMSMALSLVAFRGVGDRERRPGAGIRRLADVRSRRVVAGAAAVGVGLVLTLWACTGFMESADSYRYEWLAWIAGAGLALLGFAVMDRRGEEWARVLGRGVRVRLSRERLAELGLLALILVLALAVRLPNLDTLPPGLYHDEVVNLRRGLELGNTDRAIPPYDPYTTSPPAYTMMVWLSSEVVGKSMVTGRLVSVVLGVLGVGAIYLLGRRIMGPPLGLLAAATLAFLAWDLNWSRIGMENIAAPLCAALAAWATLRAIATGRVSDYALAGAISAAGVWYYEAYYFFAFVVAAMLLHALLRSRGDARRAVATGTVVMGLLAVVWAAPVVTYALDEYDEFMKRSRQVSIFHERPLERSLPELRSNLGKHFRMYHFEGDHNGRHNLPGRPMLDHVAGALLLLGVALSAWRFRRTGLVTLPLWMLVMMVPAIMTVGYEAPQSLRAIHVLPAVALLAALPMALAWRATTRHHALLKGSVRGAVVAATLLVAWFGVSLYFGDQAAHPKVYAEFSTDVTLMGQDVPRRLAEGYAIGVSSELRGNSNAELLTLWPRPTALDLTRDIPIDPRIVGDRAGMAIYVHRDTPAMADALSLYYPDAKAVAAVSPGSDRVLFYRVAIRREDLWDVTGLARAGDPERALADTGSLYDAGPGEYRGALHVRRDGEHRFLVRGAGVRVRLGGVELDQDGPTEAIRLAQGLHDLRVTVDDDVELGAALFWSGPEVREFRPVGVPNLFHGHAAPAGLRGRYYRAGDTTDVMDPVEQRTEPEVMAAMPSVNRLYWKHGPPVPRPFLVILDGYLHAPGDGLHEFRVDHCYGDLAILVDGQVALSGDHSEGALELAHGPHPVQLRFLTQRYESRCELYWRYPGQERFRPIPVEAISPYDDGDLPAG